MSIRITEIPASHGSMRVESSARNPLFGGSLQALPLYCTAPRAGSHKKLRLSQSIAEHALIVAQREASATCLRLVEYTRPPFWAAWWPTPVIPLAHSKAESPLEGLVSGAALFLLPLSTGEPETGARSAASRSDGCVLPVRLPARRHHPRKCPGFQSTGGNRPLPNPVFAIFTRQTRRVRFFGADGGRAGQPESVGHSVCSAARSAGLGQQSDLAANSYWTADPGDAPFCFTGVVISGPTTSLSAVLAVWARLRTGFSPSMSDRPSLL